MRSVILLSCALVLSNGAGRAQSLALDIIATQVLLDRAGFSPGEIDGQAGSNTRRAVNAFQRAHALDVTGNLDEATRQKLEALSGGQPPLIEYTIAPDDVSGPFTPNIPSDIMQQARLNALGYRSPLEALGERFHASPALLERLNPDATFARAGERVRVPNVEVAELPPASGRASRGAAGGAQPATSDAVTIYVTKETESLTVEDAAGRVLFHAPVTSGSPRDPLPIGEWAVTRVQPMPVFHYNPSLFWDADPTHERARVAAGPNNPVGTVWIDLTKEHYGLHGTPEPSRIGYAQSHGCVRLTNWDIQRVARWARPGTPVIFR